MRKFRCIHCLGCQLGSNNVCLISTLLTNLNNIFNCLEIISSRGLCCIRREGPKRPWNPLVPSYPYDFLKLQRLVLQRSIFFKDFQHPKTVPDNTGFWNVRSVNYKEKISNLVVILNNLSTDDHRRMREISGDFICQQRTRTWKTDSQISLDCLKIWKQVRWKGHSVLSLPQWLREITLLEYYYHRAKWATDIDDDIRYSAYLRMASSSKEVEQYHKCRNSSYLQYCLGVQYRDNAV